MFSAEDNKVRDQDQVTKSYKGSPDWSCNIIPKLTKKFLVMFHNLKGYESHLIMQEIGMFDVKINIRPNGLEQSMDFTINKNLVFINNIQFMNSSLNPLVSR